MCPLVTTSLQEQQQAAAASTNVYSQPLNQLKNWFFNDPIVRENLAQSGAVILYTTNANGGGTSAMTSNSRIRMTTGATIGNDVDVRLADNAFARIATWDGVDNRNSYECDIIWRTASTTDMETFIGLITVGTNAISALPTTNAHLGIQLNQSSSNNWFLTSGNFSAQVTTDTGVAVAGSAFGRVNIIHNGLNSATIRFFDGSTLNTLQSTQTVTSLGTDITKVHFFVQTEAAATKTIDISEWYVRWT